MTCGTECSETSQMSHCLSEQHVQEIGVTANNTDSTSHEIGGLQNLDYLNCTKTVLFSLKNKKKMPINTRSMPEFDVHPFAYIKQKSAFLKCPSLCK